MAHPNEELIRRLYKARAQEEWGTVRSILSPGIIWHEPLFYGAFGGDHAGVDAVFREVFNRYDRDYEGSGLELHDVLANGEHAVALVSWWAARGGKRVDGREVAVYHVREGAVTEVWFFPDDDYREFFA